MSHQKTALTDIVVQSRARGGRRHAELGQQIDPRHLLAPAGGAAAAGRPGRRRQFFFAIDAAAAAATAALDHNLSYGVIDNRSPNSAQCQWSVCVVDVQGKIAKEAKVASEPEALVAFFSALGVAVKRIGLEAGPLSQWLHAGIKRAEPA